MKHLLIRSWPILFIALVCTILFFCNYTPGTYLTGWDNLHPEYNFFLNIKRSVFAVWEEYQGLGLLGGHAHSSDLFRQLSLLFLSFFLPQSLLRYLSTFAMLFLGSVGAYLLSRVLLLREKPRSLSLVVGLFYLLNLATIQTFYVPFESFIAHFASLPWLILSSLLYVKKPERKQLLFLVLTLLFSAPAAYIPTLFLVYLMVVAISILPFLFRKQPFPILRSSSKLFGVIVLVNAFWLLPFIYFTINNAYINLESKINQSATQTIFLQNKEYGTVGNMMLLKGFWFKSVDPNFDGVFTYMLAPWQNHFNNPLVTFLGLTFFFIIFIGFLWCIFSKKPIYLSFALLFIFCFIAMAVATPPFSWVNQLVRDHFSLLNQAFRFPFTKFSILTGLIYAVLFGLGIEFLFEKGKVYLGAPRSLGKVVAALCVILLGVYTLPAFQGHLFYEKERLAVPKEYFDLFNFFKDQDPSTRIADLPQYTFWGWNFYRWGYGGSGFLWYGIEQPILDRAFDVWSQTDENYYYEISNALYSKNPQLLSNVINKYQITWLVVDKNVIYPPSPKALLLDELDGMITAVPGTKKVASFGNLVVYKTSLKRTITSFVSTASSLPTVNPYSWNHFDKAYQDLGDYQTDLTKENASYYYPFRSLFTDKTEKEREFTATDNSPTITFSQMLPAHFSTSPLRVPSLTALENILPVTISTNRTGATLTITATLQSPQITLGSTTTGGDITQETLFTIHLDPKKPAPNYILNTNGVVDFAIPLTSQRIGTTFLTLDQDSIFVLSDKTSKTVSRVVLSSAAIASLPLFKERLIYTDSAKEQLLSVTLPKIDDGFLSASLDPHQFQSIQNCDNFRHGTVDSSITTSGNTTLLTLTTQNATACVPFFLGNLPHREGYAIFITSRNESGQSLHFWMENTDAKSGSLDTYLPQGDEEVSTAFILPPLEQYGNSYALHFDNISIGKEVTQNTLKRVSIYPIPYAFLTSLVFAKNPPQVTAVASHPLVVSHPDESDYEVTSLPEDQSRLILSQTYDKGWFAYQTSGGLSSLFPALFGKRLPHIEVNNWENGWILPAGYQDDTRIRILYLPQYLEWMGFFLLFLVLLWTGIRMLQHGRSKPHI